MADGERTVRDLRSLPVFGPSYAACGRCELQPQQKAEKTATAYRPAKFNGVMIVGEGPGRREVTQNEPFVGKSGELLRALLEHAKLDRDECYITNATLCLPPGKTGTLDESFPHAIHSCLSRLEAEIAAVRPRIIVALGAAAMTSLLGYEEVSKKRVALPCSCGDDRRVLAIQCSSRNKETKEKCGWMLQHEDGELRETDTALRIALGRKREEWLLARRPASCPGCGSSLENQKPKRVKCPICGGLKTKEESSTSFKCDYSIGKVEGAVWPGAWLDLDRFGVEHVICTFHPAFLLRPPSEDQKVMAGQFAATAVMHHFEKVARLLKEPVAWKLKPYTTPATTAAAVVRDYFKRFPPHEHEWDVDVETEAWGKDEDGKPIKLDARDEYAVTKISVIGIGSYTVPEILSVDLREPNEELLDALQDFLEDDKALKDFMNGFYDVIVLRRVHDFRVAGYADELMVAHHNLYPDEDHDLAHMTHEFTDAPAWKPPRQVKGVEAHESFEELCRYNAKDVQNTGLCRVAMGAERGEARPGGLLSREGLAELYPLDMKMLRIALEMTFTGLPIDRSALNKVGFDAQRRIFDALMFMRETMDDPRFRPTQKNLVRCLYGEKPHGLGLTPPAYTDKTQQPSTKKEHLLLLVAEHPFIEHLLNYKKHKKLLSTYVLGSDLTPREDGRIHPIWKVTTVRTGRWSSSPNFQNWPRWMRSCIVVPPGRAICGSDFAQLEYRIMAGLSNDAELIRRCITADESRKLEPEFDPHSYVASLAFGKTFTALDLKDPKHDKANKKCKCETCTRKLLREIAKRVVYGLNYGAGAKRVRESIYAGGYEGPPLTLEQIKRTTAIFFEAFPGVARHRDEVLERALETRELRSPIYGRRRVFPLGEVEAPTAYNYEIQSGAADIMNTRLALLHERLPSVDASARLIAQVHDAIYVECDEQRADSVAKLVKETLTWKRALIDGGIAMEFPVATKIGKNWMEAS